MSLLEASVIYTWAPGMWAYSKGDIIINPPLPLPSLSWFHQTELAQELRPVYNDPTQLNSTSSWSCVAINGPLVSTIREALCVLKNVARTEVQPSNLHPLAVWMCVLVNDDPVLRMRILPTSFLRFDTFSLPEVLKLRRARAMRWLPYQFPDRSAMQIKSSQMWSMRASLVLLSADLAEWIGGPPTTREHITSCTLSVCRPVVCFAVLVK